MPAMAVAINPFPGMNPYLEHRWGDVHTRLVSYAADQLQDRLPPELRARMQERVFIESFDANGGGRGFYPDVHVYERPGTPAPSVPDGAGSTGAGGLAVAAPLVIRIASAEVTESYVEIIDSRSGGRV